MKKATQYDYFNSATYRHVATGTAFFTDYCRTMIQTILTGKWEGGNRNIPGGQFY